MRHPAVLLVSVALVLATGAGCFDRDLSRRSAAQLESMLRSSPDDPEVLRWLGRRLVERGDEKTGFDHLARACDLLPDDASVWADAVLAAHRAHGLASADAVATEFLQRHPADPKVSRARSMAYTAESEGDPVDAGKFGRLCTAWRVDPACPGAGVRLARLLDESGFHRAARQCLERVVQADPRNAEAWHHLGRLRSAFDVPGAIQALERASELMPDQALLRLDLASVLMTANRGAEAASHWDAALRLAPDDPVVCRSVARAWWKDPAKRPEAARLVRSQLERDPSNHDLLALWGTVRMEERDYRAARRCWEQALLGVVEDRAEVLYSLSRCLAKLGASPEAERVSRQARQLKEAEFDHGRAIELAFRSPENPRLRLDLARSHRQRSETVRAVSQYRAAVALSPLDRSLRKESEAFERSIGEDRVAREMAVFEAMVAFEREIGK
jgi:cytochrome c-type biogenesis protein CcmH/NrfG